MDNPEKLTTLGIQDTGQINVTETEGDTSNQEWTIQRNWQHWVHKTQDKYTLQKPKWGNQEWTIQRNW